MSKEVTFDLGPAKVRATGTVVKKNPKTVWVRLSTGNVIKRNITKHNVQEV